MFGDLGALAARPTSSRARVRSDLPREAKHIDEVRRDSVRAAGGKKTARTAVLVRRISPESKDVSTTVARAASAERGIWMSPYRSKGEEWTRLNVLVDEIPPGAGGRAPARSWHGGQ